MEQEELKEEITKSYKPIKLNDMIKKGTFTSVWDGDTEITTKAVLNTETGEVTAEAVEADDVDILDREYFTDEDGEEYPVCSECHSFILKAIMDEGINFKNLLFKRQVCSDPDCENQ
jgi:hypothetical protein